MSDIEKIINGAWENKDQINPNSDKKIKDTINQIIADLDSGKVRVAEKINGEWVTHQHLKKDTELREELLKLDIEIYCATNGSKEHAINCMKKIGIDDLFEGKIMDIVDFQFKPKPNPESLKLMCDKFKIPTSEETVYIEDIAKNLSSDTAKDMTKVWFINDQPINDIEKYKDVIDYKIDNLALFLKKIRLLKEK